MRLLTIVIGCLFLFSLNHSGSKRRGGSRGVFESNHRLSPKDQAL